MKKTLILMAAAASVVLTGCTESDLSSDTSLAKESAPSAIEFSAKTGNTATTRGVTPVDYNSGIIGNDDATNRGIKDLKKARFGVFAYFTGNTDYNRESPTTTPNFMYNQELQWSESDPANMWIYSPVKYWPNGIDADNLGDPSYTALQKEAGKLSFFAFAPYTAATGAYETVETYPSTIAMTDLQKTGNTETGVTAITDNEWTGNVWVKYKMPNASQSEAVDLLWGLAGKANYNEADGEDLAFTIGQSYNTNLTKQTVGERVSFLFKHALAKVGGATTETDDETLTGTPKQCGFMVVADVDNNDGDNQKTYFPSSFNSKETLITIKEVKIQDGKSASDDGEVTTITGLDSNLNTFGWFNIETGQWSDKAGTFGPGTNGATYNIRVLNTNEDLTDGVYSLNEVIRELAGGAGKSGSASTNDKELLNDAGKEWSTANPTGVTTTPQKLFANENVPGLLVIPGGTANDLYITVDYYVRTADPNLATGFTQVEQRITNKVSLGSALNPNKYYTIIMHLGLTSVKFEAVVTDWAQTSDATFDDNGNVIEGTDDNEKKVYLPSNVVSANSWDIAKSTPSYPAKGGDITLTVQMNSNALGYDATADETHYSLAIADSPTWLTNNTGTLHADANTTIQKRTAIVNVTTVVNGNTITTPITLEQAGFSLAGTVAGAGNTVVVKDGDNQNITTGYTYTVSGGDGAGTATDSEQTITVGGTSGQTYNVTVTHTTSGATKTVSVTIEP